MAPALIAPLLIATLACSQGAADIADECSLPRRLHATALRAFMAGRFSDAEDLWLAALSEAEATAPGCPMRGQLMGQLAEARSAAGKRLGAIEIRGRALRESAPTDGDSLLLMKQRQAEDLDAVGRHDDAGALWKSILKAREDAGAQSAYADALAMYADHLASSSRPQDALAFLDRSIEARKALGEDDLFVEKRRADFLGQAGQRPLAIAVLRRVIAEAGSRGVPRLILADWHEELADLEHREGDVQASRSSYSRALELAPEDDVGHNARVLQKILSAERASGELAAAAATEKHLDGVLQKAQFGTISQREPIDLLSR
jgi:tetratricopeptide (TPR) repeat protein